MDDTTHAGSLLAAVPSSLEPDAHGQAALLLAESMLHALVEAHVLTIEQALSAIRTTCVIKAEIAEKTGESLGRMHESLGLLKAIASSFDAYAKRDP